MTICWICGAIADSKEHKIKKSDLKLLYKSISQKSPVYQRVNGEKRKYLGGYNSAGFKFGDLICQNCNNNLSQPYDHAWSQLSAFIKNNWASIYDSNQIVLSQVFNSDLLNNVVLIQLYYAKILGCKIKESNLDYDLQDISESIKNSKENKNIYLSFRSSKNNYSNSYSATSDLEVYKIKDSILYIHFFITLGVFSVDIIYSHDTSNIELNGGKRPSEIYKNGIINLTTVQYAQKYI